MSSKPVYPKIHGKSRLLAATQTILTRGLGYELTQQIGGGGFSTCVSLIFVDPL